MARPSLEVQLGLPPDLENSRVLVVDPLTRTQIAEQPVDRARRLEFSNLPAKVLEVRLETPLGQITERVDLTSAADASVFLEPELIEVSGTVFLGTEAQSLAAVDFVATNGHKFETQTDDAGFFRILSLAPLRQVVIRLGAENSTPFREFFYDPIRHPENETFTCRMRRSWFGFLISRQENASHKPAWA